LLTEAIYALLLHSDAKPAPEPVLSIVILPLNPLLIKQLAAAFANGYMVEFPATVNSPELSMIDCTGVVSVCVGASLFLSSCILGRYSNLDKSCVYTEMVQYISIVRLEKLIIILSEPKVKCRVTIFFKADI